MLKLERMELNGFKSFNERTEILFDEGVTAVVGPNGCGKSNILDAMSWVLGEQSAKVLRGSAMADLIFNGSEKRRPLGMAEVTLSLRATNGDLPNGAGRVDVTRRLLRSGESGYLLNGTPCRLKDIHDVLYGSGLGVRAYSFIEQNRIGAILSAKPIDRRELIEEAAGITKFRAKKREAELKLHSAQDNLGRVRDIISEIQKQMASLKRQASKARRFERVRKDLRATLIELYSREFADLRSRAHEAIERFRVEAARRVQLTEAVGRSEAEVEALRLQIEKQEASVRGTADKLHECELEVDRNRNVIVTGRERLEELEVRARELGESLAAGRARHGELESELGVKLQEAQAAARREIEAREALAGHRERRDVAEARVAKSEAELDGHRTQLLAVVQRVAQLEGSVEARQRRAEELEERQSVAATAVEGLGMAERDAVMVAVSRRDDATRAEAKVTALGDAVRTAFEQAQALAVGRDDARARLEEARHELQTREERARAIDQIVAAAEDVGEASATAIAALGDRVHGLVADLLRADVRYEQAVGAALETVLGAVVLSDARAAIEALAIATARKDGGPLKLLLVDDSERGGMHPQAVLARHEAGVHGVLSEFVTLSDVVAAALGPLVGRSLLVETVEVALGLRATYPSLNFVTIAGEVVSADGVVQTGSRSGPGLLALRREQRELETTLAEFGAAVERQTADFKSLQSAADEAEAAARSAVERLHLGEKELLASRHRAEGAEADEAKQKELLRSRNQELEALEKAMIEARGACEQDVLDLGRAEDQVAEIDQYIEVARAAVLATRADVVKLASELLLAEAEFARSEEAHKSARTHIERLRVAVEERAGEIRAIEEDRSGSLERGRGLEREVDQAEESLTELFADVAALKDRLRTEDDGARALRHDLQQRELKLKEFRHEAEIQRERVQGIEIERTRTDGELARLGERSRDDLGLELDELADAAASQEESAAARALDAELAADGADSDGAAVVDATAASASDADVPPDGDDFDEVSPEPRRADFEGLNLADLRARAVDLKAKLSRIGPVNELAVAEYQELKERDDFLSGQVRDLTDSIESLVGTINRINRTSRERFRDAYEHVARNFSETYQVLFGGGRAELRLTDEDNLLETGIDIVAQPPGKRLQNILLLSGGEKALTAISLLFALFQYKPSPFCILDEVDAPLDEKNIDRFAGLLRTMSTGTQFILITHSPRTMRVADTLYGVTMEEPGVSRLVSVRFNESKGRGVPAVA